MRIAIAGCALLLWFCVACESANEVARNHEVSATQTNVGGVPTVQLSQGPGALALSGGIRHLDSDLTIGNAADGFGYVRDVAVAHDGTIVVLDAQVAALVFFDTLGRKIGEVGRRGRGPGEFLNPIAVAASGHEVVVWDADPGKTFAFVDVTEQRMRSTAAADIAGDWSPTLREAHDFMAPREIRTGWEDLTRRLGPVGDTFFIHQIQRNEVSALREGDTAWFAAPPSYLVRYNMAGRVVDTLFTLQAPPALFTTATTPTGQPLPGGLPAQQLYPARPLWAATRDWIAVAQGALPEVTIWDLQESGKIPLLKITWPPSRRKTSDEDHLTYLEWLFEEAPKFGDAVPPDYPGSKRKRRTYLEQILPELRQVLPLPEYTPELLALFAAENCLWLAGFNPADHPDGTALTLVAIDATRVSVDAVRIARRGARIRTITGHAIYTVYADEEGVQRIERYPHGLRHCRPETG